MLETGRNKILILVDWFAPGYKAGGPIQSCVNVSFLLKDYYDVYVLTSDRDFNESEPYPSIKSDVWSNELHPSINVYYASPSTLNRRAIKEIIEKVDADFIYLNHLFSPLFVIYPLWLSFYGGAKGKIVLCPRGALYSSALRIKRYKKIPVLALFKLMGMLKKVRFHATNAKERDAILKHFPGSSIVIADNLPNSQQPPMVFVEKHRGLLKCIFVARLHPIKNLLFFLNVLLEVKSEVILTIVGPIEDESYWKLCEQTISRLPPNVSVHNVGSVPNVHLHRYLSSSHLFVSTTHGENFGHSIFESFLSGRPVLISDQTPWQNLQSAGIGWELPLNNPGAFINALETAAAWKQEEFEERAHAAWEYANCFIKDGDLKEQYFNLFS